MTLCASVHALAPAKDEIHAALWFPLAAAVGMVSFVLALALWRARRLRATVAGAPRRLGTELGFRECQGWWTGESRGRKVAIRGVTLDDRRGPPPHERVAILRFAIPVSDVPAAWNVSVRFDEGPPASAAQLASRAARVPEAALDALFDFAKVRQGVFVGSRRRIPGLSEVALPGAETVIVHDTPEVDLASTMAAERIKILVRLAEHLETACGREERPGGLG